VVGPGAEQMLYVQALERVHDLNDARRGRLVDAQEGLPALMWVVLVSGGVIVVGFTYLFGLGNTVVHALMIGALAAIISCRCSPSPPSITRSGAACRSDPKRSSRCWAGSRAAS
jgi:hypothetical protein